MIVEMITTTVVPTTSFFPGQVTFFISAAVSRKNSRVDNHHCFGLFATATVSMYVLHGCRLSALGCRIRQLRADTREPLRCLAGQEGLEPPTCGFGDRCSAN